MAEGVMDNRNSGAEPTQVSADWLACIWENSSRP